MTTDEIKALLDGATPGPWEQSHRESLGGGHFTQVYPAADPDNSIATLHWHSVKTERGWTTDREANARLIAAAPDLAALALRQAQEIERLRGTLAYLLRQAENGTLPPQVVMQNARAALAGRATSYAAAVRAVDEILKRKH